MQDYLDKKQLPGTWTWTWTWIWTLHPGSELSTLDLNMVARSQVPDVFGSPWSLDNDARTWIGIWNLADQTLRHQFGCSNLVSEHLLRNFNDGDELLFRYSALRIIYGDGALLRLCSAR